MQVVWKQNALEDRAKIIAYIALDKPLSAVEFGDILIEKSKILELMPMLGRIGKIAGTRELVAHQNYILIYQITQTAIEILNVKHVAQQYP